MKVNVIGISKVSYINKNGKDINGFQLFCTAQSSSENVTGQIWVGKREKFSYSPIFVSTSVTDRVSLGAYDMQFDLYGNVSSMEKLKVE